VLVTVIASGMAAMLLLATTRVGQGAMTIGGLVLVNTYLLQLIRPMERLGQLYRSSKPSLVDLEQLLALLDERPGVVDRPGARPLVAGRRWSAPAHRHAVHELCESDPTQKGCTLDHLCASFDHGRHQRHRRRVRA
jgi:ABC-type transport system involved in Fe-S cluster assembly fused permease/ATPase subunit